jgi:hypothetical protein
MTAWVRKYFVILELVVGLLGLVLAVSQYRHSTRTVESVEALALGGWMLVFCLDACRELLGAHPKRNRWVRFLSGVLGVLAVVSLPTAWWLWRYGGNFWTSIASAFGAAGALSRPPGSTRRTDPPIVTR